MAGRKVLGCNAYSCPLRPALASWRQHLHTRSLACATNLHVRVCHNQPPQPLTLVSEAIWSHVVGLGLHLLCATRKVVGARSSAVRRQCVAQHSWMRSALFYAPRCLHHALVVHGHTPEHTPGGQTGKAGPPTLSTSNLVILDPNALRGTYVVVLTAPVLRAPIICRLGGTKKQGSGVGGVCHKAPGTPVAPQGGARCLTP